MRYMKWIGLAAALLLLFSCFIDWVYIESGNITVSGVSSGATNFGKPGYFHFGMLAFFIFFTFMARIWAKRANLLVTALNLGWAIRNFIMISACQMGDCPEKKMGLFLSLGASVLMLVTALLPDMKIREKIKNNSE